MTEQALAPQAPAGQAPAGQAPDHLPAGLLELGQQLGSAIDQRLGRAVVGDTDAWVRMPQLLTEPHSPQQPTEPVPWGTGALCVDLGPEDESTWQRFASTVADETDVELVASAAQQWRLAVTPYRSLPTQIPPPPASATPASATPAAAAPVPPTNIAGANVIDLTSMWAGPLCTQLLAKAGAQVTKITTAKRPDGLANSPMYQPLNSAKQTVELDLDLPTDRREFEQLLAGADLLVTSLSPRALRNFDLEPAKFARTAPQLRTLAITAFDGATPEADWIAYGTGVHAASGLGWQHTRPAFSYPDPLAGLLACEVAIELLKPSDTKPSSDPNQQLKQHRRVSLAEAVQPLVHLAVRALPCAP